MLLKYDKHPKFDMHLQKSVQLLGCISYAVGSFCIMKTQADIIYINVKNFIILLTIIIFKFIIKVTDKEAGNGRKFAPD